MIQIGIIGILVMLAMIANSLIYEIRQAEKRIAKKLEKLIDILIEQKGK